MKYYNNSILLSLLDIQSNLIFSNTLSKNIAIGFELIADISKSSKINLYAYNECVQGQLCSSQLYKYKTKDKKLITNNPKLQNILYHKSISHWLSTFLEDKNIEETIVQDNITISILYMPILIDKKLWGYVSLEKKERVWDDFFKDSLKIFFVSLSKAIINHNNCKNITNDKNIYELLYQKAYNAIFLIKDFKLVDINDRTKEIFGGDNKDDFEKNIGLNLFIISPEFQENLENSFDYSIKLMNKCLEDGVSKFQWQFRRFDDILFLADVVLVKIEIDNKPYIHGSLVDVTRKVENDKLIKQESVELRTVSNSLQARVKTEIEKNRKQDRLIHSQSKSAQMGEMLNMIAHQWRQPLNSMSASAIKIAMKQELDLLDEKEIVNHSEFIQNQTQKMSKVIDNFMNFFKPENEKSDFTIDECFENIESIMSAQLLTRGITLVYDKNSAYILHSYPKELSHVLINLISNSKDAFENTDITNKQISIGISSLKDGKCLLKVKDNAGGIPENIIDKIFNPYFTTKEQGKGTGIGLYITRRVVEEVLDGTIKVENTNNGAKFNIKFKA